MCPPWPRLEPLGLSEPEHSAGSSSHKLKQLVTKADCKSPQNQSKPRFSVFSFLGLLSEKLIAGSLTYNSVATLRTTLEISATALPQSLALPCHPRQAWPCLRSPWAPEPVSPDTGCVSKSTVTFAPCAPASASDLAQNLRRATCPANFLLPFSFPFTKAAHPKKQPSKTV